MNCISTGFNPKRGGGAENFWIWICVFSQGFRSSRQSAHCQLVTGSSHPTP